MQIVAVKKQFNQYESLWRLAFLSGGVVLSELVLMEFLPTMRSSRNMLETAYNAGQP
jgi:hypothetical protein